MSQHPSERTPEELFRDHEDVASYRASQGDPPHELAGLERTEESARRSLLDQKALLEGLEDEVTAQDEELIRDALERATLAEGPARGNRVLSLVTGLVAVAAALLFFLWPGTSADLPEFDQHEQELGAGQGVRFRLDLTDDGRPRLRVTAPREEGDRLSLGVFELSNGKRAGSVLEPLELEGSDWIPTDEQIERLPEEFGIELIRNGRETLHSETFLRSELQAAGGSGALILPSPDEELDPARERLVLAIHDTLHTEPLHRRRAIGLLDSYMQADQPGGQETREAALELIERVLADEGQLRPHQVLWLTLESARIRTHLGRIPLARETLVAAVERADREDRPSLFQLFHCALMLSSLSRSEREFAESRTYFELARDLLETLGEEGMHLDREFRLRREEVRLAIELGLGEKALQLAGENMALARSLGERERHQALLDRLDAAIGARLWSFVLDLVQRARARSELPPRSVPDAYYVDLREAIARIRLEEQGRRPRDQVLRDPVALIDTAIRSGGLDSTEVRFAKLWEGRALLLRGDVTAARELFEELRRDADPELVSATLKESLLVLECRLALREAGPSVTRDLLERVRKAWYEGIARWKQSLEVAEISAPLHESSTNFSAYALVQLARRIDGEDLGLREAFGDLLAAQSAASLSLVLEAEPPSLDEILDELLAPSEIGLFYVLTNQGGLVLALDEDGLDCIELQAGYLALEQRHALDLALDIAMSDGGSSAWEEVEREARVLRDHALPAELLERIEASSGLVICNLETLGYIPFEMLPGPRGEPLGLSHTIRYLPGLPATAVLERRQTGRSRDESVTAKAALFAADRPGITSTGESATPLELSPEDYARVLGPYEEIELRFREAADRRGLMSLLEFDADVLHVIAHGHQERSRLRPASLWMGGEEPLLRPETIETLEVPPLVLLSTCGAWRGPRRRGDDGRAHLSGAFHIAGASTVILAEDDLLLGPTLTFTAGIHRELLAGKTPAQAMLHARQRFMETPRTPAERAQVLMLHLSGVGNTPLFEGSSAPRRSLLWIGGAALLLSLVLAFGGSRGRRAAWRDPLRDG